MTTLMRQLKMNLVGTSAKVLLNDLATCSSGTFISRGCHSDPKGRNKTTHFGFQTIPEDEKADKVLGVFHNVADRYDIMNDFMSSGVHRVWKDQFIQKLDPSPGDKILDMAGGTGDITFRILEHMQRKGIEDDIFTNVTCCDINASMLEVGKKKSEQNVRIRGKVDWKEADAMKLPFENNTFDAYTIAFGIRNVVRIDEALSEAYRILRPGGRFMCLEFSHVSNPILGSIYDFYSFQVIPLMGKVIAGDWDSYQYLVESIRKFPNQDTFKEMIQNAGFRAVCYEDLTFGVAAIHSGFKLK